MDFPMSTPTNSRGRLTDRGTRARVSMRDGDARPWRVTSDPSSMFLNGTFRESDLSAGGFDQGTIFVNARTGEKRIANADGVARKGQRGKPKGQRGKPKGLRKKLMQVKPVKKGTGSGGTHAVL